jgi:hypothetical protein
MGTSEDRTPPRARWLAAYHRPCEQQVDAIHDPIPDGAGSFAFFVHLAIVKVSGSAALKTSSLPQQSTNSAHDTSRQLSILHRQTTEQCPSSREAL